MDFNAQKPIKFLFSIYSEIPKLPKEVTFGHIISSLFIVFFIIFMLFRKNLLKFSNKTVSYTTKKLHNEEFTKDEEIEKNILKEIKIWIDNQTKKLINYINQSRKDMRKKNK